jgi:hypothetical protein
MGGMMNFDLVTRPDSLARSPNLVTTALAKAEALAEEELNLKRVVAWWDANLRQDEEAGDHE